MRRITEKLMIAIHDSLTHGELREYLDEIKEIKNQDIECGFTSGQTLEIDVDNVIISIKFKEGEFTTYEKIS